MGFRQDSQYYISFFVVDELAIRLRFEALAPVLDERERRRFAAAEAVTAGRRLLRAIMFQSWPPNRGQAAKVDRDLRRTIYDDDAQTVYG